MNPQWPEAAVIEYRFEEIQQLRFEIYDRDSKNENLKKQDYIGWYETEVSKIMGADGNTVSSRLYRKRKKKKKPKFLKKAKFVVIGEEVAQNKDVVNFCFRAEKLDRKNMAGLGSADPFFIISNEQNGKMVRVFESDVIKKTRKPQWKTYRMPVVTICNGDYDRKLRVDIFDWESDGKHNYIGSFTTTLEELTKTNQFNVNNASKKKKKSSGTMFVEHCDIVDRSSFLDFIQGGCEMKLTVAVDFTGSNGHPSEKSSLHFLPPNFIYNKESTQVHELNDYQKTLLSVGQVVQDYDTDRKIPVYGFGANLGPGPMDMHCFPLTLNPKKHEVKGVKGVMKAYQHALKHVTLSGPTHFAPIINKVIATTEEPTQANQSYSVLLIITDGIVNDMPKTIDAIIEASNKPISIIIVGVGETDWAPMEVLDADKNKLSQNGRSAKRDIVQFVPYDKFKSQGMTALAEEVLKEIPYQIESYFKQKKIKPNHKVETPPAHFEPLPVLEMSDSEDEE